MADEKNNPYLDYLHAAPKESAFYTPTENEANPYLKTAEQSEDRAIRSALNAAKGVNPDQYSNVVKLSERVNLPPELVERNQKDIEQLAEVEANPYLEYLKQAPKTANYLANPENMKAAKDDIEALTGVEWLLKAPLEAWRQGRQDVESGELGFKRLFRGLTEEEQARLTAIENRPYTEFGAENWIEKAVVGAPNILPMMVETLKSGLKGGLAGAGIGASVAGIAGQAGPQIALPEEIATVPAAAVAGYFFGSRAGAMKKSFELEAGFAYNEFLTFVDDQGKPIDEDVARVGAIAAGAINAGLELFSLNTILKTIPGGDRLLGNVSRGTVKNALRQPTVRAALKNFTVNYGKALTTETLTEVAQEATTIIAGELAKLTAEGDFESLSAVEATDRLKEVAEKTAQAMTLLAAPGPGARFTTDVRKARKAELNLATLNALSDSAKSSKYLQRLPEKYQDFVRSVKEQGHVENIYIENKKFQEYWQSQNLDPNQVAQELGIADQIDEASTVGDLVIPIEAYMAKIAATEHHGGLVQDLRLFRGDMSAREAQEFNQGLADEFSKEAEKLAQDQAIETELDSSSEKVYNDVKNQLLNIGRDEKVADSEATLQKAWFSVMGRRTGVDPFDLYKSQNVVFRKGESSTDLGALQQGEQITSTKEFKNWFKKSKIADENGDPLIVYHGTGANITEFSFDFTGQGRDQFGSGFYFTNDIKQAQRYTTATIEDKQKLGGADSPNIVKAYLSLQNPLDSEQVGSISENQIQKMLKYAPKAAYEEGLSNWGDVGYQSVKSILAQALPSYAIEDDNIVEGLFSLANDFFGNSPEGVEAFNTAVRKVLGYDGVVINLADGVKNFVAFFPEQIKSTENQGTFDPNNPNIFKQDTNGKTARGSIVPKRFSNTGQTIISLFEKADFSTVVHESGHLFLETYAEIAQNAQTPQDVQEDYAKILNWLGVESFDQVQVKEQEQFARAIEAYLFEGKAPSVELRSVFQRFRSWLMDIYKSVVNLNVSITPEITEVFDRMFATNDQIKQAQSLYRFDPLFDNSQQAGMSQKEFDDYVALAQKATTEAQDELMSKMLEKIKRRKEKQYKAERAAVKKEVAERVVSEPIYQLLNYFKTGDLADQSLPDKLKGLKLNRKFIEDQYGEKAIEELPKNAIRNNGVNPDIIADVFGFSSGDQLIQILRNAQSQSERIEEETNRVMDERFPDLLSSESLEEETAAAMTGASRGDLLMSELRTLAKSAGVNVTPLQAIRVRAQEVISNVKVNQLQPHGYLNASVKAANLTQQAIRSGNRREAALHKFQQIYQLQLYREALKAKEAINSGIKYISKFGKKETRGKFGKAGQDYLDQIDAIMERFDFRKSITGKALERRQALFKWVEQKRDEGEAVNISERLLNEAYRKHYKELSVNQFIDVRNAIKNLEHLVNLKTKLLASVDARNFEQVKSDIIDTIASNNNLKNLDFDFAPTRNIERVKDLLSAAHASHTKMEFFFRKLDGDTPQGTVWRALFSPIAEAENDEMARMAVATKKLNAIFKRYSAKERRRFFADKVYVPEVGKSFSKTSLLTLGLNWGNADNRTAVVEGFGWTNEQAVAVLKKLDKRDWDTVQEIWDFLDSFWPDIAKLQRELTGIAPEKVKATPVTTAYGEYRGGYFPLKADPKYSFKAFQREQRDIGQELFENNYLRPQTKQGHTIERTGFGKQPVKLDFSVITDHVTNVVHDIAYRKAIIDVDRITKDREVQSLIEQAGGREMYKQIRPWLQSIANEKTEPPNFWERILNHARVGATVVNMGWKVTTAIVQPLGYLQTIDLIGARYAMQGWSSFYGNPTKMSERVKFVMDRSVMMRNRQKTFDRDVRDSLKKLTAGRDFAIRQSFFYFTGLLDMSVAMPSWLGGYEQGLDMFNGDEKKAIAHADSVVRMSQGSGSTKDLARIQRGNEAFKIFTMFYSYFSVLYNLMTRSGQKLGRTGLKSLPQFAASMAFLWFGPAVLSELIAMRGPDDDDEWADWAAQQLMIYPFQAIIGVRDVVNGVLGEYGYDFTPVAQVFETTSTLIKQTAEGEFDRKYMKNAVQAAGYWGQLPTRQMWITGEAIYDFMTGGGDVEFKDLLFPRRK